MTVCARCGKKIGWRDHRLNPIFKNALKAGLFPDFQDKKLCRQCPVELLDTKDIPWRGFSAEANSRKRIKELCRGMQSTTEGADEKLVIKNPVLGFTPQYLSELTEQLRANGRKTCLDCVFCELREKEVEKASVTNLLGALAGAPIEYEIRINLVCRKFLLDLNDKLESAVECSSFLTEKEYHKKALKGEIVGFAGVTKNESIPIQNPVMATCDYCHAQYDMSLYRKCPRCGAYSPKISKEIPY